MGIEARGGEDGHRGRRGVDETRRWRPGGSMDPAAATASRWRCNGIWIREKLSERRRPRLFELDRAQELNFWLERAYFFLEIPY
jgi:hypothetical protein